MGLVAIIAAFLICIGAALVLALGSSSEGADA